MEKEHHTFEESDQKFRLLADFLPQLVWTSDAVGNLNYFSRAVYDFSGLRDEEIQDGGWLDIIHPDDLTGNMHEWRHAVETGEDFTFEHRFRRHDGEYRWMLSRAIAQRDHYGNIVMWVGTSTDIHDQKSMASELEQRVDQRTQELSRANEELARSNTELASFSYVASHDLQEPLRKIQAFANRILEKDKANLSEPSQEYFRRMQNSTRRMQRLISDLLDYSRLNTINQPFQPTDLNVLLAEVKNELKESLDEKNGVVRSMSLPRLGVVPFQFVQLLTNLIGNSLKFAKPGVPPQINIAASKIRGSEIPGFHAIPDRLYYKFTVTDNGIGFDQKFNEVIFQVFQRLHGRNEYGGTGIGLAICKKIVDNHQGYITATGIPDAGATFTFFIPIL